MQTKLHSIQYLRFFAAFLVLMGHVFMEAHGFHILPQSVNAWIELYPWGAGVDLFFIISGFIIYAALSRLPATSISAADFMAKRLIRIVPAYWLFTGLMALAILFAGRHVEAQDLSLQHILASLAFIPWVHPSSGDLRPLLGQGWTLNYEMLFYLIAGLAVWIEPRFRVAFISAIIIALFAAAASNLGGNETWSRFLGYSVILEFLMGMWMCCYAAALRRIPGGLRVGLATGGAILLALAPHFPDMPRVIMQGLPAAMIFAAFVRNEGNRGQAAGWLERLGDASYSLYLSHPFVINGVNLLFRDYFADKPLQFIAATVLLSVATSVAIYEIFESPLINAGKALWSRRVTARLRPRSEAGLSTADWTSASAHPYRESKATAG